MNKFTTIAIAFAILGGAATVATLMVAGREEPERETHEDRGVPDETVEVHRTLHPLNVRASGVVVPARQVEVLPQVSGRIVWLFEHLTPGTFVEKGQVLFRIDARDYRLAVERVEADLQRAKSELALEMGRQELARREWELIGPSELGGKDDDIDPSLALREPQLEVAKGNVEAAKAQLAQTQLELARTSFAAPFDAVVAESNAEIGQLASPATRLARLVGTAAFHIRVAVAVDKIPFIAIPGIDGEEGSALTLRQQVGEKEILRSGKVIRLLSSLEPQSRMARLLVEIDDPYGLSMQTDDGVRPYPVLLDTYADVVIEGTEQRRLIDLDRQALREGNKAYVFQDSQLEIRNLEIVWQFPESVLVGDGLEDGELVVTSALSGAAPGIKLRNVTRTAESEARDALSR